MEGFLRMAEKLLGEDGANHAAQQLALYQAKKGIFANASVQDAAVTTPGALWWRTWANDKEFKELRQLAVKVLSQTAASSAAERNWSQYDFIHSSSRNKLKPERAKKLVYVFSNLRLLREATFECPETIPWADEEDEDEDEEQEQGTSEEEEEQLLFEDCEDEYE